MKLWHDLKNNLDSRSKRERVLIMFSVTFLILFVGATFGVEPLFKQQVRLQNQQQNLFTQEQTIELELTDLNQKALTDPNQALNEQIEALTKQNLALKAQVDSKLFVLVRPDEMAMTLYNILKQNQNFKVVEIETLPVVVEVKDGEGPLLFRHSFQVTMEGGYFSLLDNLKRLEKASLGVYWDVFDYKVGEYPTSALKLTLYTLSAQEAFIRG